MTCSYGPEARPTTCNVFIALRTTSNIMRLILYDTLLCHTVLHYYHLPYTIYYIPYTEYIIVHMKYYDKVRHGRGLSARGVAWRFRDPPSPQSFRSQQDIPRCRVEGSALRGFSGLGLGFQHSQLGTSLARSVWYVGKHFAQLLWGFSFGALASTLNPKPCGAFSFGALASSRFRTSAASAAATVGALVGYRGAFFADLGARDGFHDWHNGPRPAILHLDFSSQRF